LAYEFGTLVPFYYQLSRSKEKKEEMKKKRSTRILKGLKKIILAIILFLVLIFFLQNMMIFHHVSDDNSRAYLQDLGEFHEVEITGEGGKIHHGVMRRETDEVAPVIIYFGGNGEVSHSHMRMREVLNHWPFFLGHHFLFIDYDGYGLNQGRTNYNNMSETALAAYQFAVNNPYVDSEHIYVMGFSLGTYSAIYLAANREVAGLILLTPYASGYDLYNNLLPIFHGPMRMLVRQKLPAYRYAPLVTCPVLVIASHTDEIIPISSTEYLVSLFPGEVDFMELMGSSHNEVFSAPGVLIRIQDFLDEI
jgi:pimeloyl-ACP methyl ester carboxylesterase